MAAGISAGMPRLRAVLSCVPMGMIPTVAGPERVPAWVLAYRTPVEVHFA